MDDSDTATVELTRNEARKVIGALSEYHVETSGRDEERVLNVEELLQREFGFEERHFGTESSYLDTFTNIFNEKSDDHEVQLSRVEAEEVVRALDDHEATASDSSDAETTANLRDRFAEAFDPDAGSSV